MADGYLDIAQELRALAGRLEALRAAQEAPQPPPAPAPAPPAPAPAPAPPQSAGVAMAWGAKVSQAFRDRILWTASSLALNANYLMACIAFESAGTFSADVQNMAGSGAVGLIQFMPHTAALLETTTQALAAMTAEDQILYVWKYFKPFKGRLHTLSDHYMAILLPSAIGQPEDAPLFTGGTAYRQNSGLDADRDGVVTKAEAAARVQVKLTAGLLPESLGYGQPS